MVFESESGASLVLNSNQTSDSSMDVSKEASLSMLEQRVEGGHSSEARTVLSSDSIDYSEDIAISRMHFLKFWSHFKTPSKRALVISVLAVCLLAFTSGSFWYNFGKKWQNNRKAVPSKESSLGYDENHMIDSSDFEALDRLHDQVYGAVFNPKISKGELKRIAHPLLKGRWDSDRAKALLMVAHGHFLRGDIKESEGMINQALDLLPGLTTPMPNDHRLVLIHKAKIMLYQENFAGAEQALSDAQDVPGAFKHLGELAHWQGALEFSRSNLDQAIELTQVAAAMNQESTALLVSDLTMLSLYFTLEGDLENSFKMRTRARFLNASVGNYFEQPRILVAEYFWAEQAGFDGSEVLREASGYGSNGFHLFFAYVNRSIKNIKE